jgi:hypothetical protein
LTQRGREREDDDGARQNLAQGFQPHFLSFSRIGIEAKANDVEGLERGVHDARCSSRSIIASRAARLADMRAFAMATAAGGAETGSPA